MAGGSDLAVLTPEVQEGWRSFVATADHLLTEAGAAAAQHEPAFEGLDAVCNSGHAFYAAFYMKSKAEDALVKVHAVRFWQILGTIESMEDDKSHDKAMLQLEQRLHKALQDFNRVVQWHASLLSAFAVQAWSAVKRSGRSHIPLLQSLVKDFRTFAAVALTEAATSNFSSLLLQLYEWKLKHYQEWAAKKLGPQYARLLLEGEDEDEDDEEQDLSEDEWVSKDSDAHNMLKESMMTDSESFRAARSISDVLRGLRLEALCSEAYLTVVSESVHRAVSRMTKGKVTKSVLRPVSNFIASMILPFIVLMAGSVLKENWKEAGYWQQRLNWYISKTVGLMRIRDLFDIAKIYPESAPAIRDLAWCMKTCDLQRVLIRVFRHSCATRLHIPGAKTNDIIDIYVSSIKILRQVDPTGVLLEAVSGPTRDYLKSRKDTIRCIVTAMTDDKSELGGESLFYELQRPAAQDEEDEENEDDSFALMQARMWHPEAVSADTQHTARAQRMHDIISMLVQIYGSKDLFINEYRGMLAERLLAKSSFENENEIRTLEHLKMRFGESNLHNCEVMMKDLSDSKRLFNTISALPSSIRSPVRGKKRPPEGGIGPITATIISALFWPHLQEEELNLPDQVGAHLEEYAARYWVLKQPRKLIWKKHLGAVELSLKVWGVSKDFTVPPFEAAVLMHFQHTASWAADDLAKEMGSSSEVLRRKAAFWVKHGVLLESAGAAAGQVTYRRTSSLEGPGAAEEGPIYMEEEESGSALVSQEEQLKQEMAMYEQYILGMLTNFEAGLPLDRIHNMLKMFVPEQAYDKSSEQLSAFLAQLVADEKLGVNGNVYTKRTS